MGSQQPRHRPDAAHLQQGRPFLCSGDECTRSEAVGVCDKNGCGINPFATGSRDYYGPGSTVDTTKPFTVVTQFVTADGTPASPLTEIRRLYLQNGRVIPNAGVSATTSVASQFSPRAGEAGGAITQDFCTARNASSFLRLGGMSGMGGALARGMVLVFSIWNSDGDFMNWLDSGSSGPCSNTSGDPLLIVAADPDVQVTFSNIRWGDVGSTFNASGTAGAAVVNPAATKEGAAVGMRTGHLAGAAWVGMAGVMACLLFW